MGGEHEERVNQITAAICQDEGTSQSVVISEESIQLMQQIVLSQLCIVVEVIM